MAHSVLTDAKLWVDAYDFSGDANALALDYSCDEVEDTHFGDTTHVFLGGLNNFTGQFEGAVDQGDGVLEGVLFANVGVENKPITFGLATGADGEIGYTMEAMTDWKPGGSVGELLRYSVSMAATGNRLVRGTIMHNATRTATGNGTARQLGAVAAGQSLYATLHVVATVSGTSPTLDVVVASAATDSWPGTSRITFTQATGITSQFATPVAGSITDTWWRVQYTIGGTDTPTFPFIVIIGIV